MPRLCKLSAAEAAALEQPSNGDRAQVAREYDAYVAGFAIGDYGRAELHEGERRNLVRQRLQAAARRRGLALRFRSGPGPLTFRVDTAPALTVATPRPAQESVGAPLVDARRDPAPPRPHPPTRRRPTAAERYREVLPRWMRDGQPPGRRGDSKRRQGR